MSEHTAENDRPCCNVIENDGIPCDGTERAGWPVFVCDSCGANCGALAHDHHRVTPPGSTADQGGRRMTHHTGSDEGQ